MKAIDLVLIYLFAINLVTFIVFGIDKRRAKKGRWRISEAMLFALAFLGGALGGWLGMRFFSHKTQHTRFNIGIPIILIVQIAILILFIIR